ncbi:uncharacterized protein LOC111039317 [Myzus persicae]|uniref:uncharacterized protein LOC111039317 n=1 Tax=Myzus persicae TaxID=13164 RepID=UPI000B9377CB|nr:uncharacterized protein LOC111039317 [Myzus persicae]
MTITEQPNNDLLFCTDGHVGHNWFLVHNTFRKCSLCRTRKLRLWTTMFKCRECKLLCHRKCFSKLVDENMDVTEAPDALPATNALDAMPAATETPDAIIPATEAPDAITTTASHQQLTEPLQQVRRMIYVVIISEVPSSTEPIDGHAIAIFLKKRILRHINYSELVARVRAAKYAQRPFPVVNCIDSSYILWGKEIHLITKFEMDDGDDYYVITICYDRCRNGNQYIGKTIFIYSPSKPHETVRVLKMLWYRPHLARIQSADRGNGNPQWFSGVVIYGVEKI